MICQIHIQILHNIPFNNVLAGVVAHEAGLVQVKYVNIRLKPRTDILFRDPQTASAREAPDPGIVPLTHSYSVIRIEDLLLCPAATFSKFSHQKSLRKSIY